jgi:tryptophan-rich sensory protein
MTRARGTVWKPVSLAFLGAVVASVLGALATDLGSWYYNLHKPTWQPPDWLFGPVWTAIFAAAAVASVLAWRHAPDRSSRVRMVQAFIINIALNVGWSALFFRMQRPDYALIEVALLWASIAALIVLMWPYSKMSSALVFPYLAWVTFAAFLNLTIVRLNAPFHAG